MKHTTNFFGRINAALTSGLLVFVTYSSCAEDLSSLQPIPRSIFVIPTNATQGRDPFYPTTTRSPAGGEVSEKSTSTVDVTSLVLNGLSGAPGHRLAMINGKTFAEGETNEIATASGRITVHCIEIKNESAIVEMGGRTHELRLRKK